MRYYLSLFFMVLLAVILQQFVPTFTGLFGAQLLLVTLVFLCASVTVPTPVMLALAFLCGFLHDAEQVVISVPIGDPDVYGRPEPFLPFGYSIFLYGVIGYLMQSIQPLFQRGRLLVPSLLVGISIFLYLIVEYLLINFIRGGFTFGYFTFFKIAFTAAFAMFGSPLLFWVLEILARKFGHHTNLQSQPSRSLAY